MSRTTLLSAVALAAVAVSACESDPAAGPSWSLVFEDLPGALFSVSGTAADDVYAVGAEMNDGKGPTLLHYDGAAWTRLDTGVTAGDLLWIHVFADGSAVTAGRDGLMLRLQGGAATKMTTPSPKDVWGVWGSSPDDLWAVGGAASGSTAGFVWRYDGSDWTDVTVPLTRGAFWKVWGRAADDVFIVGTEGALMHWDGTDFEVLDAGTERQLLTINGRADGSVVTSVGGFISATMVESTGGGAWADVTPGPDAPQQLNGVYHRGDEAWSVGNYGAVAHRVGDAWQVVTDPLLDGIPGLHAVWIDPDGGVWAVGGQIIVPPFIQGTVVYRGTTPPSSEL